MQNPPIFDGHNDTVLALCASEPDKRRDFFTQSEQGHIDFPRAQAGGLAGGFFAMYTRSPERLASMPGDYIKEDGSYEIPLPTPPEQIDALKSTVSMATKLLSVEKQSQGQIKIVRTADELAHCLDNGIFAMLLHIEGAEAIDTDFESLHVFYAMGLRSIGPVWSRPNAFGYGVPFKYPATPDIGPGLTDAGKALVRECNQLGVLIDLSHLNEKGFWDVASLSDAPLVATHSNAHALSATPRNLTDKQLDALAESNGVAGMNYHIGFLREDGRSDKETSLAEIARHAAYIAERIGVDHVALGSDFDGATMPQDLRDAAGLPKLMDALREYGFSEADLEKIAYKNWLRVLRATWK
ncbi:MAG: dipeptidase [Caldilineaceae bacterium]